MRGLAAGWSASLGTLRTAHGFTLMEIIVVLAVVATLVAALTPMIIGYITDAQRARAANDAQQIAGAVLKMFTDTGKFAFKKNGPGPNSKEAADADVLTTAEGATPTEATGTAWNLATTAVKDTIENQLLSNTPFQGAAGTPYASTGRSAWKGPYLDKPKPDPWGNQYLVNIGKADPAAATPKAVFVISAGPNGQLETNADQNATVAVTAGGDDIIARVK